MPAVPQSLVQVHINVRNTHDGKSSPCLVDVDVLDAAENFNFPLPTLGAAAVRAQRFQLQEALVLAVGEQLRGRAIRGLVLASKRLALLHDTAQKRYAVVVERVRSPHKVAWPRGPAALPPLLGRPLLTLALGRRVSVCRGRPKPLDALDEGKGTHLARRQPTRWQ